ncbi:MAG: TIGR04086 family membrane protein [Clostridia bacterium]|nr:TIGR04086 family membrane protein [Clostridia bacterium]
MRGLEKTRKINMHPIRYYGLSFASGAVLSIAVLCIAAVLMLKKDIGQSFLPFFCYLSVGMGSICFSFAAAKHTGLRALICGAICGGLFGAVFLLITAAFNGMQFNLLSLLLVPISIAAGIIGSIVGKNV